MAGAAGSIPQDPWRNFHTRLVPSPPAPSDFLSQRKQTPRPARSPRTIADLSFFLCFFPEPSQHFDKISALVLKIGLSPDRARPVFSAVSKLPPNGGVQAPLSPFSNLQRRRPPGTPCIGNFPSLFPFRKGRLFRKYGHFCRLFSSLAGPTAGFVGLKLHLFPNPRPAPREI